MWVRVGNVMLANMAEDNALSIGANFSNWLWGHMPHPNHTPLCNKDYVINNHSSWVLQLRK